MCFASPSRGLLVEFFHPFILSCRDELTGLSDGGLLGDASMHGYASLPIDGSSRREAASQKRRRIARWTDPIGSASM
jgi:hypothetical protein